MKWELRKIQAAGLLPFMCRMTIGAAEAPIVFVGVSVCLCFYASCDAVKSLARRFAPRWVRAWMGTVVGLGGHTLSATRSLCR